MKQTKLRRRRVLRYSILYFAMFILFAALIAGPLVAGKFIMPTLESTLKFGKMVLVQPDVNQDNTRNSTMTGTGRPSYSGAYTPTTVAAKRPAETAGTNDRLF